MIFILPAPYYIVYCVLYLNFKFAASHLKLSSDSIDFRPKVTVWICRLGIQTQIFGWIPRSSENSRYWATNLKLKLLQIADREKRFDRYYSFILINYFKDQIWRKYRPDTWSQERRPDSNQINIKINIRQVVIVCLYV